MSLNNDPVASRNHTVQNNGNLESTTDTTEHIQNNHNRLEPNDVDYSSTAHLDTYFSDEKVIIPEIDHVSIFVFGCQSKNK